jgi:hypothetical protein
MANGIRKWIPRRNGIWTESCAGLSALAEISSFIGKQASGSGSESVVVRDDGSPMCQI